MAKTSVGKIIGASALGAVAALVLPLSLLFSPVFFLTPLITSLLWAWAGAVPAVLASVLSLFVAYLMGGGLFLAPAALALCLPGWLFIWEIRAKKPFRDGLYQSVVGQLLLLLAAVFALWLPLGRDLVGALVEDTRAMVSSLPILFVDQFLILLGRAGFFGSGTGVDFTKAILTLAEHQNLVETSLNLMATDLRLSLPSLLLTGGIGTGVLGYWLPRWVLARRGADGEQDFLHLKDFRLPRDMVVWPTVLVIVALLLDAMNVSGADSAYLTLLNLALLLFLMQGAGALDRFLHRARLSRGKRVAAIVAMLLIGQWVLRFGGVYSAVFGSQGLLTKRIKDRMDGNHRGGDEE